MANQSEKAPVPPPDLKECPRCTHPMVRLSTFEELSPSDTAFEGLGWLAEVGWYLMDITLILFWILACWIAGLLGLAAGRLRTRRRQTRLNQIRRRILPRHPESLICANCLRVIKR
jgi:hypothetical protein